MQPKASRLFLFILCLVTITVNAQNITKSPYSIVGVGDLQFYGTSMQSAMGQTGQALRRSVNINMLNPASYSALKYTVFDGGAFYSSGSLSNGNAQNSIETFSFSYFSFAVPLSVKKNIGMAFGLSPYSAVGYNVAQTQQYPDYVGTITSTGSGGINAFHFGVGAQLIKKLSVGFNANYLFGQTIRTQSLIVPEDYNKTNLAETRRRNVNDFQVDLGTQFHHNFEKGIRKDKYEFVAGLTYTLGTNISAKETYFMRSLGVGGTTFARDTISYVVDKQGSIHLPSAIKGGLSYEKKDHWQLTGDVNYTTWSSFKEFGVSQPVVNSWGANIGGSFIPNLTDYKNYFKRIEYRAGARYDNGNYAILGQQISTYAVSAGIGLPLGKSRSRLNLSAEYIVKGTTTNNAIREEYYRFTIGLNFSDRWFLRYKYD